MPKLIAEVYTHTEFFSVLWAQFPWWTKTLIFLAILLAFFLPPATRSRSRSWGGGSGGYGYRRRRHRRKRWDENWD